MKQIAHITACDYHMTTLAIIVGYRRHDYIAKYQSGHCFNSVNIVPFSSFPIIDFNHVQPLKENLLYMQASGD